MMGVVSAYAAQPVTEITLPGTRLFTESITSTKDGTLFAGSVGKGNVSRIPHATTTVTEWIKPGTNGLNAVYGVFADEKFKTLWVCSNKYDDGMDIVTFSGQNAEIKTIKSGLEATPAVTATRGMAWIAEGKLNYRNDPKLKDKDPGTFKIYAVPLPRS
jgi:DNA-binding beta-propeller fold protein YncE